MQLFFQRLAQATTSLDVFEVTRARTTHFHLRWEGIALIAIMIAGLSIRAFRLDFPLLWMDEAITLAMAKRPVAELFGPNIAVETSPPIYYVLQHFWLLFGESNGALRALPVVFGVLTIPAAWMLGRSVAGSRSGLLTALLVATGPMFIHFSREIRGYSMLALFATVSLACLVHLLRASTQDRTTTLKQQWYWLLWLGYVISTSVVVHAHNTGLTLPFLTTLFAAWLYWKRSITVSFLIHWFCAHVIVLLSISWWLPVLFGQLGEQPTAWIPEPSWQVVKGNLLGVYPYWAPAKALMLLLGIAGFVALYKSNRRVAWLSLILLAGHPILMYLVSLDTPAFIRRALVWPSVMYFLLLGVLLARVRRIEVLLPAVAVIVIIQLSAARADFPAGRIDSLLSPFAATLHSANEQDAVVIAPQNLEWDLRASLGDWPFGDHVYGLNHGDALPVSWNWMLSESTDRSDLLNRLQGLQTVWLITESEASFPIAEADSFDSVMRELFAEYPSVREWHSERHALYRLSRE